MVQLWPLFLSKYAFVHFLCFQIGQFFGMIDPSLMRNMMNVSLYSLNKTYDYQALCEPTKESKAAAGLRSVYVVSFIFFEFISVPHDLK